MTSNEEERARTHNKEYISDSDFESDHTSESKSSTLSDEEEDEYENAAANSSTSSSNSSNSESLLSHCVVCNGSFDGRNGNEPVINSSARSAIFQKLFAGYTGTYGSVCNVCYNVYKNHVIKQRKKSSEKKQLKEAPKEQKKAPEKEQRKSSSKEQQKASSKTEASSAQSSSSTQTGTTNSYEEICVCCDSKLTNTRRYNYQTFKKDYMILFPGSDEKPGIAVCESCYRKGRRKRQAEAKSAEKNAAKSSNGSVAKSENSPIAKSGTRNDQADKPTNKSNSKSKSSSSKKDKTEKTEEQIAKNSITNTSKPSVNKEKNNSSSASETAEGTQTKKVAKKRDREEKSTFHIDDFYAKRPRSNETEIPSVSLDQLFNVMEKSKPPTTTSPIATSIAHAPEVTIPTKPIYSPLISGEESTNQLSGMNNPLISQAVSQKETTPPSNQIASIADESSNKRLVDIFIEFRLLKVYEELFIRPESVFPKEYYETVYITRVTISIPITLTQLKEIANQKAEQVLVKDGGEPSHSIQEKYEVLSLRRVQKDYIGEELLENISSDDIFTYYPIFAKERFVVYLRKKLVNK
jgi:hypothetical protein